MPCVCRKSQAGVITSKEVITVTSTTPQAHDAKEVACAQPARPGPRNRQLSDMQMEDGDVAACDISDVYTPDTSILQETGSDAVTEITPGPNATANQDTPKSAGPPSFPSSFLSISLIPFTFL